MFTQSFIVAIYSSFIMRNFDYCPLVWHFCGQVNNQKLEKIQERALRILFADYNSSYTELLGRAGTTTLLIQRLRLIALTVFQSLHGLNPPCLNDMFTPKQVPYRMRDSCLLEQSRCRTTTFGLRSISYIGAKLWNDLPSYFKETTCLFKILRWFYKHGQGQILMTLSALMYEPHLILSTNQKFICFLYRVTLLYPSFICPLHYRLVPIVLCVSVTAVNS